MNSVRLHWDNSQRIHVSVLKVSHRQKAVRKEAEVTQAAAADREVTPRLCVTYASV